LKSLAELAMEDQRGRAAEFSTLAHLLLRSNGQMRTALAMTEQSKSISPRVRAIVKAAVSAGTLDDPSSAALVDLQIVSVGFVSSLRAYGAFDRMLADGAFRRVPLATPGIRISTSPLTGYGVAEGVGKPISRLSIAGTGLERLKADAIIVVSDALAEAASAGAQALISAELRAGVVAATDGVFLGALADGVSPVEGDGGGDPWWDIGALLQALATDASSRLYLVVSPPLGKRMATITGAGGQRVFPAMGPLGGEAAPGLPVLVTDYLPIGTGSPALPLMMAVDASQIAADSGLVTLEQARHATVEMVDEPTQTGGGTGSPSVPTAAQMVSLWQTNSRGLRASRYFGFRKLRSEAVAVMTNLSW
jgi:hypothetical protein